MLYGRCKAANQPRLDTFCDRIKHGRTSLPKVVTAPIVSKNALAKGVEMKAALIVIMMIGAVGVARAEDNLSPSRIDGITKSARDMMPAIPSMPSVSLPSMPDLSLPDFSD